MCSPFFPDSKGVLINKGPLVELTLHGNFHLLSLQVDLLKKVSLPVNAMNCVAELERGVGDKAVAVVGVNAEQFLSLCLALFFCECEMALSTVSQHLCAVWPRSSS